jgi:hypothetical protein
VVSVISILGCVQNKFRNKPYVTCPVYKFEDFIERKISSQKKRTLLSAKEKVWVVNCYNELQFNNYYNLLTTFSIFWSITSLLAFDIRNLSKNSKYFCIVVFNDIRAVTMTVCWHYLLFQFSNFEFPNLAIKLDAAN